MKDIDNVAGWVRMMPEEPEKLPTSRSRLADRLASVTEWVPASGDLRPLDRRSRGINAQEEAICI